MRPSSFRNLHVTCDPRGVVTVGLNVPGRTYNVLGEELIAELQTLVGELEHEPGVRLVLFRSNKPSGFLVGADLREIYAIRNRSTAEQIATIGQKLFERLEHLPMPTVAAIEGPCLGGGLELALACRYRLARNDDRTRLGLPEVALGLLPCWGGPQRLRELVGLAATLPMILGGRSVSARRAAALGLVDALWPAETFTSGVEQFIADRLDGKTLHRDRDRRPRLACTPAEVGPSTRPGRRARLQAARRRIAERSRGDPALLAARSAALGAIEQGLYLGRAEGLRREREVFPELLFSPGCRSRLEAFFQRPQARKPIAGATATGSAAHAPASFAAPPDVPLSAADEMPASPWVDGLTIGAALRQTAHKFAAHEALIFPRLGVRLSWAQFDQAVDSAARGLLGLGFRRGDHLGVWAPNGPEWVVLQFATARVGVVLVTINPAYRPAELQYALAQSEVRGLALSERFKSSRYDDMLRQICPEIEGAPPGELHSARFPRLRWLIRLRGAAHPAMLAWQGLEAAGQDISPSRLEEAERQLAPGDPINLQYTSGTTGPPKGALLSHRNLLMNAFYAAQGQRLGPGDRICIPVPLYHCFGCTLGTMCAAATGAAMVFPCESFDAESTLKAIESERCTAIYGVPTMFIVELERPGFPTRNLTSLRTGIMAGSPCPIELMKRVVNQMGAREITIAYGQTEAAPLITMTRSDDPLEKRVSTVGRPLPGIEVRIVDMLTGQPLPDGRPGELCCRGHNVMLGYYGMPQSTAEVIDAQGWLHTGDLALRQPDGYFRITGRIKEMIIRGGENIAPREIEELLYLHPKVEQVSVVGVPDRKFGEEVLACIKLRAGESASEDEIRDYCRARLAHFKAPRYVKFVDAFPMTVTGKIQKYKIRQQAIGELQLQEAATVETA